MAASRPPQAQFTIPKSLRELSEERAGVLDMRANLYCAWAVRTLNVASYFAFSTRKTRFVTPAGELKRIPILSEPIADHEAPNSGFATVGVNLSNFDAQQLATYAAEARVTTDVRVARALRLFHFVTDDVLDGRPSFTNGEPTSVFINLQSREVEYPYINQNNLRTTTRVPFDMLVGRYEPQFVEVDQEEQALIQS